MNVRGLHTAIHIRARSLARTGYMDASVLQLAIPSSNSVQSDSCIFLVFSSMDWRKSSKLSATVKVECAKALSLVWVELACVYRLPMCLCLIGVCDVRGLATSTWSGS